MYPTNEHHFSYFEYDRQNSFFCILRAHYLSSTLTGKPKLNI